MASETLPENPEPDTGNNISTVNINITNRLHLDAIAHGLTPSILDLEEVATNFVFQWEMRELARGGKHWRALRIALRYACRLSFGDGYKEALAARVGIYEGSTGGNLAIFLSFRDTATSAASIPGEGAGNADGGAQSEPAAQSGQEVRVRGMRRSTKKWVARRILDAMLHIYGNVAFPEQIRFLEDWTANRPPSILLLHSSGRASSVNLLRTSNPLCRMIVDQMSAAGVPAEGRDPVQTLLNLEELYISER